MCPAIHINSRSWLRSSSTHEPSDPPHRVVKINVFLVTSRGPRPGSLEDVATVSKCFYTQPVWKKTNGFEERAICCGITPRSLLAPAPAAPGKGDGGLLESTHRVRRGLIRSQNRDVSGETPALRAEFENRADGTSRVGSPSRPTTLLREEAGTGARCEGVDMFPDRSSTTEAARFERSSMIHPQVHLRIPCYDFYVLYPR